MRETKMGLVYSWPSARFSHMYKVEIIIGGKPYNSVEQKLQFEKAVRTKEMKIAAKVMETTCTFAINDLGDKIPLSKEWIKALRPIAAEANAAKFGQHKFLMEALLATGKKHLIEGTTSSFWGSGARYEPFAYDLEDAHGCKTQGLMLPSSRRPPPWQIRPEEDCELPTVLF